MVFVVVWIIWLVSDQCYLFLCSCDRVIKLVSSMALPGDRGELRVQESLEELSTDLVDYIAELSEASVKERGVFAIALSGGSLIGLMGYLCLPF